MKKLLIAFILLGIFSCKKKEEPAPEPPPPSTPAPARTNAMSATVNGKTWVVEGNLTATANISQSVYNGTPKQYVIGGRTGQDFRNSIHLGFAYTTGTATFVPFTSFYALYYDSLGLQYSAKSGTMNITLIDTSHVKSTTGCDKFKATFSFVTGTLLGVSYTVNEGSIDFEAK